MMEKFEVILSLKNVEPVEGQIVIYQNKSDWNDFKYKIRCKYRAKIKNRFLDGSILVGINDVVKKAEEGTPVYDFTSLFEYLEEKLSSKSTNFAFGENIYTLLPSLGSYRELVRELGWDFAEVFLLSLNDMAYARSEKSDKWFENIIKTECFIRAFMRNSEPFFAYNNADMFFGAIPEEDFSRISSDLSLRFQLEGFHLEHKLELKYSNEDIIPRRINVLIGKNGLGKSQALNKFCRAALGYNDKSIELKGRGSSRPMINRILAIGTPGETANTFPVERRKTQKLYYRRLNLTRSSLTKGIGNLLVELARSPDMIGEKERWDIFVDAIERVIPLRELFMPLTNGGYLNVKKLRYSSEQERLDSYAMIKAFADPRRGVNGNYFPLSSGQLTFLKFAILCCLYIENGSFVLMDEPETHLHPNLISQFVDMLDYILEKTGSQALIATHSAYFVREVPRDQVHVFMEVETGYVNVVHPRLRTFGADIDSISQFVFEDDFESDLVNKLLNNLRESGAKSIPEEVESELSVGASMFITRSLKEWG
jgi:ABC-type dipeptide/oligopeptide/nickel transport system ATPase component